MELDAMLFLRLINDMELGSKLALFDNRPAVFYQLAPSEDNVKWNDKSQQYPRIDYSIDMQEDPARSVSGILVINVWCDTSLDIEPESIEGVLRDILHVSFAQPENDSAYCLVWSRSDAFEATEQSLQSKQQSARIIGCTVIFDIMACPSQYTTYPDPIKAINLWTKSVLTEAVVIGEDEIGGWSVPISEKPIVYWRLTSQSTHERKHVLTWLNATIEGHVFSKGANERLYFLRKLSTAAALAHHIRMEDTSPMFIQDFNINPSLNYLAAGQIQARTRFGILQDFYANPSPVPKLTNINTTFKYRQE